MNITEKCVEAFLVCGSQGKKVDTFEVTQEEGKPLKVIYKCKVGK